MKYVLYLIYSIFHSKIENKQTLNIDNYHTRYRTFVGESTFTNCGDNKCSTSIVDP